MQKFLQKFNDIYKGKPYIEIEFINDNPLTKKFVRYNQSGEVCYCIEGNNTASQKTINGWQPIECNENCQYRQKNELGKCICNRIGWLKFLIPAISTDRVWLMKITGQTSINRIDTYINLQKAQGNSLKNRYILFLKQEEQTSTTTGKTFNNYILDILKREDFLSEQTISQTIKKDKEVSTTNEQNVNNNVAKKEQKVVTTNNSNITQIENNKTKEGATAKNNATTKRQSKSKKTVENNVQKMEQEQNCTQTKAAYTKEDLKNCYALLRTYPETLTNKNGERKEYLIGEFANMEDQISNIVIRPEDATELAGCDLGTFVKLEVNEIKGRKFAMKLEYIEKTLKKVAA